MTVIRSSYDFDMDMTEKELHIASELPAIVQAEQLINRHGISQVGL